jgi:putative addiction module killer protein
MCLRPGISATASLCSGDYANCGFDWGPGYRVYDAKECVLLLFGGDKRKQAADIEWALENLKDYNERSGIS